MYGVIVGTIGKDAVLKSLETGVQVLEFTMVENAWVGSEKSTWYVCSMFGKRGASLESKLRKGAKISASGQSYQDEFDNAQGDKVKVLRCKVTDVIIQAFSQSGGQSAHNYGDNGHEVQRQAPTRQPPSVEKERFEDDIPF
jgi:single-strand DNA-binding protein